MVTPNADFWLTYGPAVISDPGTRYLSHDLVGASTLLSATTLQFNTTEDYAGQGTIRQIAIDPVNGLVFLVQAYRQGSNYSNFRIIEGKISSLGPTGSPNSFTTVFDSGTDPAHSGATDFTFVGGGTLSGGLRVDTTNHTLYFVDGYSNGSLNGTFFEKINYSIIPSLGTNHVVITKPNIGSSTSEGNYPGILNDIAVDYNNNVSYVTNVDYSSLNGLDSNFFIKINNSTGAQSFVTLADHYETSAHANLTGTGTVQTKLFDPNFGSLQGLALDPVNQKLYFTTQLSYVSPVSAGLFVLDLGTGQVSAIWTATTYHQGGAGPQGPLGKVAIDVSRGLYYVQSGNQIDNAGGAGLNSDAGIFTGSLNDRNNTSTPVKVVGAPTSDTFAGFAFNAAPSLGVTSAGATFTESGSNPQSANVAPVAVVASSTAGDPDTSTNTTQLAGATVTVTSGFTTGDQLSATVSGSITQSYNAGTGVLTLSGVDTFAHYQTVLNSIRFGSTSEDPTAHGAAATRTLTFNVSDGLLPSADATVTVAVTGVNDAPSFTAAPTLNLAETNAGLVGSQGVTVADPDSTQVTLQALSVTASGATAGAPSNATLLSYLSLSTVNLSAATPSGTSTASFNSGAQAFDYLAAGQTLTLTYVLRATDNNVSGGGSVQTTDQTFSVVVTGTNDAPTVNGTTQVLTSVQGNTTPAGQTVSSIFAGHFADVDSGAAFTGVAVTANGSAAASGQWQFSPDGVAWTNVGAATPGAAVLLHAASQLRFLPANGFVGSAPALSANLVDDTRTAFTDGATASLSSPGGATPYSTGTVSLSLTVDPPFINTAPAFTKGADQAASEDSGPHSVAGWATAISAGPAADAGQTVNFIVTNDNTTLFSVQPTVSASGALTYTSAPDANGSATVSVRAHDDGGVASGGADTSAAQTFVIAIAAVDDTPVITGAAASQAVGDAAALQPFGAIGVTDPDVASYTATVAYAGANGILAGGGFSGAAGSVSFVGASPAAVQAALRALVFTPTANQVAPGATVTTAFTLTLSESQVTATDATTSVVATSLNDAPTVTASQSFSAAENQTAVGTVLATDPDVGDARTFALAGAGVDNALFNVSSAGVLSFRAAPDFEGAHGPSYAVTVQATDSHGGLSAPVAVTVGVTNVNEAPIVTASQSFSAAENQTVIGTVLATDPDAGDTRTFALAGSGADNALFNLSSTGVLSFVAAPDFEGPHGNTYAVTVQATDAGALTSAITAVTVAVTDVNEAPVVTANQSFSAPENQTAVGTVLATDPDVGDTRTFALAGAGADNALFTLSPAGVLSFIVAPDFEGAHGPSYAVTIQATDSHGLSGAPVAVTINLANVNEAPVVTANQSFSAPENQTAAGTIFATDPDAGDTRSFTLTGTGVDNALFNISPAGVLTFITAPDFEGAGAHGNTYAVTLQATDAAGATSAITPVTVTVTDVNEAPVVTAAQTFSAPENQTAVGTVLATDPDIGDTRTFALAGAGADNASFNISTAGVLTFRAAPDFEGAHGPSYVVTVQATDSHGLPGAAVPVTVVVTNVNEAPVVTASQSFSAPENQTLAGTILATDPDANDTRTFALIGPGADNALFNLSSAGVLTFLAAPDFEGAGAHGNAYAVTVQATDATGLPSAITPVAVTVADVNEAPAVTPGQTFAVVENQTAVGTVVGTDPDANDTRTFALAGSGADNALFSISPAGVLSFRAAPDFEGAHGNTYAVTVQATDAGALQSAIGPVTVTVSDANEAPVVVASQSFSAPENQTAVGTVLATDPDAGDTRTFALVGAGADNALFNLSSTGVLTFRTAPDFEGAHGAAYSVTVQATDAAGLTSAVVPVTIAVTNVNEAPIVTPGQSFSAPENQTAVGIVLATDPDTGDTHTFALTGTGVDNALFNISPAGVLTFRTAPDFEGPHGNTYAVTVQATDAGGLTSAITPATVAVTDVYEPPPPPPPPSGLIVGAGVYRIDDSLTIISFDISATGTVEFGSSGPVSFTGSMSGTGTLAKTGTGVLILSGANTYTGPTQVTGGLLLVDGTVPNSAVTVGSGATLGGHGTTGSATLQSGATFSPGDSPGTITTGSLSLASGAFYKEEFGGFAAGQFDVVTVRGAVALNGATLNTSLFGGFTLSQSSSPLVIIDNDGVDAITGTFAGLAEGATFTLGGAPVKISYVGGDGNDVSLTFGAPVPMSAAAVAFATQASNLVRARAGSADALDSSGPIYAQLLASQAIVAQLDAGKLSAADAQTALFHIVDATTSVAEISYAFFTGKTPTAAGLNYLVHDAGNPSDLNDAYYLQFNIENRYINFAVNLSTGPGAGAAAFSAAYGNLSLADAGAKAYAAVFGSAPVAGKIDAILNAQVPNGLGGQETRAQYFADVSGGTPQAQKAALIGWLLGDSVKEGFGAYQQADQHFLQDLAHGTALFNIDLLAAYALAPGLVGQSVLDPTAPG